MAGQRRSRSIWTQLLMRTFSIVILLISLGLAVFCTTGFGEDLTQVYVMLSLVLALNIAVSVWACAMLFGTASAPRRPELVCLALVDLIAVILAAIAGCILIIGRRTPECGSGDCSALRFDPARPSRIVAGWCLVAASIAA
ncbi:hypothetical protein B0T14DRAFT_283680 [Immersiella caudata]|uniref:Uncharacterized protein n=1 Tax=Immersiella caudata TaxID=314043 RepID=A0AA39WE32_9PEZI|nr:hypothetical protein B0T14DRAFT_283680 [Immersiella caudata]